MEIIAVQDSYRVENTTTTKSGHEKNKETVGLVDHISIHKYGIFSIKQSFYLYLSLFLSNVSNYLSLSLSILSFSIHLSLLPTRNNIFSSNERSHTNNIGIIENQLCPFR